LWFLAWPIVVWRWARRATWVPEKERSVIRGDCVVVVIALVPFPVLMYGESDFFFWILATMGICYYMRWGVITFRRVTVLVRKYGTESTALERGRLPP
jgi:hypothetical protein